MTIIAKFPDRSLKRRLAARLPRRSKNGTPEERAAKRAAAGEIIQLGHARPGVSTASRERPRCPAALADLQAVLTVLTRADKPGCDPVISMIGQHREAVALINAKGSFRDDQDALDAACDAERAVEKMIRSGEHCRTLAGAVAALRYIAQYEIDGRCDNKPAMHFVLRMADAIERIADAQS